MSTKIELPPDLPPLPKIPKGYRYGLYKGLSWESETPVMYAYFSTYLYCWQVVTRPREATGGPGHFVEVLRDNSQDDVMWQARADRLEAAIMEHMKSRTATSWVPPLDADKALWAALGGGGAGEGK